ncbi:unnamed protein product [Brachionus calyciflorus]|uniref:RBR-type E3 ubiquitin transferase n=1 Tax=Brachionus calyciflorus TaxID=104777 RepID=A0A813M2S0_9BILA|nr:unnamed protein product [Brachionus calyciflorus]
MNKASQTSNVDEDDDGGALRTIDRKSLNNNNDEKTDPFLRKSKSQKSTKKSQTNTRMQPFNTRLRSVVEIIRNRFNQTNSSNKRNSTTPQQIQKPTPKKIESEIRHNDDQSNECLICYLKFPLNDDDDIKSTGNYMYPIETCEHSFCVECLRQYLKYQITESRVSISCPECNEKMHPNDIYKLLRHNVETSQESIPNSPKSTNSLIKENSKNEDFSPLINKYEEFMLRRVLASIADTRWCPAPDCTYAVIASGCANCPQLYCQRPNCNTSFCYHCKQYWHPNLTCEDAALKNLDNNLKKSNSNIKLRNLLQRSNSHLSLTSLNGTSSPNWMNLNSIQTNRNSDWSKEEIKQCPKCQALIVKMDDGSCNHITCPVCGCEFCWLCMKEISDLHYLSPSGCTFWGKKPWSRKKKIMWQLGTLIGAPVGIALIAGVAVPAILIGLPIWSGRKVYVRYKSMKKFKRNLIVVGTVFGTILVSPLVAALAVGIGVPILLAYVYGVVPISLCRSGGCGVTTNGGVRFAFDDEENIFNFSNTNNNNNQAIGNSNINNTNNSVTVPISAIEPKPENSVVVSTQSSSVKAKKSSLKKQTPLYVTITMASNSDTTNVSTNTNKTKTRNRSTSNRRKNSSSKNSKKVTTSLANTCGSVEVLSSKNEKLTLSKTNSGAHIQGTLDTETGTGMTILDKNLSEKTTSDSSTSNIIEKLNETKTDLTEIIEIKNSCHSTRRSSTSSKRLNENSIKKMISSKIVNNPSISEMSIGLASLSATSAYHYKDEDEDFDEDQDSTDSKMDLYDRESASNKALAGASIQSEKLTISKNIKFSESKDTSLLDDSKSFKCNIEIKSNYTLNSLENKNQINSNDCLLNDNCNISIKSEKSTNPSTTALLGSLKDNASVSHF